MGDRLKGKWLLWPGLEVFLARQIENRLAMAE
jgi:hypothetical protein